MPKAKTRLFWYLILIASVAALLYLYATSFPVEFSIGEVDNRFGIAKGEVVELSKDAASRWNSSMGKEVLAYNEGVSLKIDLIYDQRQADLDELKRQVAGLEAQRQEVSTKKQQLERQISKYERDLDNYNNTVQMWNSSGSSITESEFEELQRDRDALEKRYDSLVRQARLFDKNIQTYNENIAKLKIVIDEKAGEIEEVGVYAHRENEIGVFMFEDEDQLRLVLMHELGHAIGAGHTKNPSSIMYELVGEQDFADPRIYPEDIQAVNALTRSVNVVSGLVTSMTSRLSQIQSVDSRQTSVD